jgi:hypothetical protein
MGGHFQVCSLWDLDDGTEPNTGIQNTESSVLVLVLLLFFFFHLLSSVYEPSCGHYYYALRLENIAS